MNCHRLLSLATVLSCILVGSALPDTGRLSLSTERHLLQKVASASSGASATRSVNNKGSVSASSKAKSTEGESKSLAEANAEVFSEAENKIVSVVKESFVRVRNNDDVEVVVKAQSEAVATAIATAFAKSLVQVSVTGQGEACGDAEASAQASATSFATAFAGAVALAENAGQIADADSIAESTSNATANAFAEAQSSACTTGGFSSASQESFAEAVADAYAFALADVLALVTEDGGDAKSQSTAKSNVTNESVFADTTSNTTVEGKGNADVEGDAGAETGRAAPPSKDGDNKTTGESDGSKEPKIEDQTVGGGAAEGSVPMSDPEPNPSPTPVISRGKDILTSDLSTCSAKFQICCRSFRIDDEVCRCSGRNCLMDKLSDSPVIWELRGGIGERFRCLCDNVKVTRKPPSSRPSSGGRSASELLADIGIGIFGG